MFIEIAIHSLTRYKAEPRCVQKTGQMQARWQTFQPPSHTNLVVLKKSPEKPGD